MSFSLLGKRFARYFQRAESSLVFAERIKAVI